MIWGFDDLSAGGPDASGPGDDGAATTDGAGSSDAGSSDGSAGDTSTGQDAASNDGASTGDGSPLPPNAPAAVVFHDLDPAQGKVAGTISITRALDENSVESYVLYWGSSPTTRLEAIATLPKTGSNLTYPLGVDGGSIVAPAGADYVLAFSKSAAVETGPASTYGDSFPRYFDISAGRTADNTSVNALVDTRSKKLLVVTQYGTNNGDAGGATLVLFRCELDGTGCVAKDIGAGQPGGSGYAPSATIDPTADGGALLVATENIANSGAPGFFRCNLDGTGCTYTDISLGTGHTANAAWFPSIAVTPSSAFVHVFTQDNSAGNKLGLFRCYTNGTSCFYIDVSVGQPIQSGLNPSAVVDPSNNDDLLVVTDNGANSDKLALFHCNHNGTSCTYADISAGQGANSGSSPSAVIDTVNGKLLVATRNGANSNKPGLFRCELDGGGCTHTDISNGQGPGSGGAPSAVVDTVNKKLLVVTQDGSNMAKPTLFRCDLDGQNCTHTDLSVGHASSGYSPSAVIDTASARLLVATDNGGNADKPALFTLGLW